MHPKPLSLEKCTWYFEKVTAMAFERTMDAELEVMGMRNGQPVIFKKGCKPTIVEPKITKAKSPIKTLR